MRKADAELFKDKIEVSLDGRQIFYLFFGGAVIASLVFVLGVMVGKRLESRSHVADNAQTSAAHDPLAALDELGADDRAQPLEFPQMLVGNSKAPTIRPEVVKADDEQAKAPTKAARKVAAPAPKPESTKGVAKAPAAKPKAGPGAAAAPAAKKSARKAKFTLQLSSFQDRAEAESFHAELTSAGYQPYIREANVPGKGLWYRVRLGRYVSHKDALSAKADFEKRQRIIAYVTRL